MICPNCGKSEFKKYNPCLEYYVCENCDLVYTKKEIRLEKEIERLREALSEIIEEWDNQGNILYFADMAQRIAKQALEDGE